MTSIHKWMMSMYTYQRLTMDTTYSLLITFWPWKHVACVCVHSVCISTYMHVIRRHTDGVGGGGGVGGMVAVVHVWHAVPISLRVTHVCQCCRWCLHVRNNSRTTPPISLSALELATLSPLTTTTPPPPPPTRLLAQAVQNAGRPCPKGDAFDWVMRCRGGGGGGVTHSHRWLLIPPLLHPPAPLSFAAGTFSPSLHNTQWPGTWEGQKYKKTQKNTVLHLTNESNFLPESTECGAHTSIGALNYLTLIQINNKSLRHRGDARGSRATAYGHPTQVVSLIYNGRTKNKLK